MSIELKIKASTLTAEARIIRKIEQRMRKQINYLKDRVGAEQFTPPPTHEELAAWLTEAREQRNSIQTHRRYIVRPEARKTHLVRGFLKGLPYSAMEAKVHLCNRLSAGDWKAMEAMVTKYGIGDMRDRMQRFEEWRQGAGP